MAVAWRRWMFGIVGIGAFAVLTLFSGRKVEDEAIDTVAARARMVDLISRRGVEDPRVLAAMGMVPRHEFVLESHRHVAYDDRPLPIGLGQTISQPYIVAFMTEAARLRAGDKVLEVGTGSGYQAAVLAACGARVFSVELLPELASRAEATLDRLGFDSVIVRAGDGYAGWPSEAPFDAILVTAAPPEVPPILLTQLADGGRLVVPVGPTDGTQTLEVHTRQGDDFQLRRLLLVRFVPMIRPSPQRARAH